MDQPMAMLRNFCNCSCDNFTLLRSELDRRAGHAFPLAEKFGFVGFDEGLSESVVIRVHSAARVAVKPRAVGAKGDEVGERARTQSCLSKCNASGTATVRERGGNDAWKQLCDCK